MAEEININRRKFLKLSTKMALGLAGLLGLGGLVRYFSHEPEGNTPTSYDLGSVNDFPAGGKLVRLDIPAVIYEKQNGYQAISLACTHLGCTLEDDQANWICPCHGSRFGSDGQLLEGPAAEGLKILNVELADGRLILHTGGDWK